jgi:hypothetical protein
MRYIGRETAEENGLGTLRPQTTGLGEAGTITLPIGQSVQEGRKEAPVVHRRTLRWQQR